MLAACAKRTVIEHYGIDAVLSVIVHDIKDMELNGIQVSADSYSGLVRPTLFQVIGDNLGLHEMLGFVGSFSANYPCRFCRSPKDVTRQQVTEDLSLLRNKTNFLQDLEEDNVSKSGVKRSSELNKLDNFHVCENYVADVMHDFLEGVFPLEFKLVVGLLVEQGCFTLQQLNDRLSSFNYGFEDKKNKPSSISSSAVANPTGASGQKASQMKCLALYFPLIMSDLVDENSEVWELFLLLLDVFKMVMAPYISKGGTHVLRALIKDHHHHFLHLFQSRHLIPKHHNMVHYPRLIQMLGPLGQYSSLRKEGKHKPFKRWARACNNYKNITKTVAERHQQQQSLLFLLRRPLGCDIEINDQLPVQLSSIDEAHDLSSMLKCGLDDTVIVVGSVRIQMYGFKPKCMLLSNWEENGPQFAQLKRIVLVQDVLYFIAHLWETIFYDRHKHAYAVQESKQVLIKQPQNLCLCRPLHITKTYSKTDQFWYIIVPFNIV